METPLFTYTLRLADDALILGHCLSEWCGHAPVIEEDMALANIALDLLGQARALFSYAGEVEGKGRDEDMLAYLRDERRYTNLLLVEQPNGDFAHTIVRQLLVSAFQKPLYAALMHSKDATLAAIAAKAEKEVAYHLRHSAEWAIRLGDGTQESHERMQEALETLWPFTGEMFAVDAPLQALIDASVAVDPRLLKAEWDATLDHVLGEAMLSRPHDGWMQAGGREGRHTENLGHILSELQYMQRTYPGARW